MVPTIKIFTNKKQTVDTTTGNNNPFKRQSVIIDAMSRTLFFRTEIVNNDSVIQIEDVKKTGQHDKLMLDFLQNAYPSYEKQGFDHHHMSTVMDSAGNKRIGLVPAVCNPNVPEAVLQKLPVWKRVGFYCNEFTTPIFDHTLETILNSMTSSRNGALELISNPKTTPYVLTCSPGHHAGFKYYSGYCYLNNAFFAAKTIVSSNAFAKVAILDLDYHAGDGTQDIFESNSGYEFNYYPVSLNINPVYDYPHYKGFNDAKHFLTFEPKCTIEQYITLMKRATELIKKENCTHLVVAFGADTYMNDPENLESSRTLIDITDYIRIGRVMREIGLPTMVVQEGGMIWKLSVIL